LFRRFSASRSAAHAGCAPASVAQVRRRGIRSLCFVGAEADFSRVFAVAWSLGGAGGCRGGPPNPPCIFALFLHVLLAHCRSHLAHCCTFHALRLKARSAYYLRPLQGGGKVGVAAAHAGVACAETTPSSLPLAGGGGVLFCTRRELPPPPARGRE